MQQRFQLSGESLPALKAEILEKYGPAARIVGAEQVTRGGIAGFFANRHVEVTVELPQKAAPQDNPVQRAGIAALLAEADEREDHFRGAAPVSTATREFDILLKEVSVGDAPPVPAREPEVLAHAGALVLVAGPSGRVLAAARALAAKADPATLYTAGLTVETGLPELHDHAGAFAARVDALSAGRSIVVACGTGSTAGTLAPLAAELADLGPDQVWAVVDAARKAEDTGAWLAALAGSVKVAGLAAYGRADTATPETVTGYGIPVTWMDNGTP